MRIQILSGRKDELRWRIAGKPKETSRGCLLASDTDTGTVRSAFRPVDVELTDAPPVIWRTWAGEEIQLNIAEAGVAFT
jgi:hypothetical protein